jgi:disulfide oxidoreductase YuzD
MQSVLTQDLNYPDVSTGGKYIHSGNNRKKRFYDDKQQNNIQ